ncbi:MAG: outer membrane protein assembly factor BamA [Candidatus Latescibacterota bacterium]
MGPRVDSNAVRVSDILVQGTQRIEPDTVRSYMTLKQGDPYSSRQVNASLKTLFATGLFADVTIRKQGTSIIVQVVENPVVNRIAFEGNDEIEDETLSSEVQLRSRIVFTRKRVQGDVKRLLQLYRSGGYFSARIEPKVIQLPQNRVDLVFEIDEGKETLISRITFLGNRFFTDDALRNVIQTKEDRWYRIFSSADTYDPDRLTFDRELLRRFYLEKGFADFRVVSAVAELTADKDNFFVTFTIEEGERYKFGKLEATSRIKEIKSDNLSPLIQVKPEAWYSASKIDDILLSLTNYAGDRGFAFVEARPVVNRDRKKKTISVTFELQEAPKVFVERINIMGNVRTLDSVIRREFRLVEGDAFNAAKLRRSRQRIQNLGYFGKVDFSKRKGSDNSKSVIDVKLEEQSTGEINLGLGFSTTDGGLVSAGITERNFLGKGQNVRAKFSLSQRTQNFDLGFTEPYFLNKDLSAGIDLFKSEKDNTDESSFTSKRLGIGLHLGYEINEQWSQSLRYLVRRDQITEVASDGSVFIRQQDGDTVTSLVGQDIVLDARNSKFSPTDGFVVRASTDIAGLGGDAKYVRAKLASAVHYKIINDWVLNFSGEVNQIQDFGEKLSINDLFFLGGDNLRGFAVAGVGPRDSTTDDALGGRTLLAGTAELHFPLGLPKELGISGAAFTDIGTLMNPLAEGAQLLDEATPRVATGVGLRWRSPFGPIRIDVALPVLKESFDKEELIHFNFGTRF